MCQERIQNNLFIEVGLFSSTLSKTLSNGSPNSPPICIPNSPPCALFRTLNTVDWALQTSASAADVLKKFLDFCTELDQPAQPVNVQPAVALPEPSPIALPTPPPFSKGHSTEEMQLHIQQAMQDSTHESEGRGLSSPKSPQVVPLTHTTELPRPQSPEKAYSDTATPSRSGNSLLYWTALKSDNFSRNPTPTGTPN